MHVTRNLDQDKFYHIDDCYKQHQKNLSEETNLIRQIQTLDKEKERITQKNYKKMEEEERTKHEAALNRIKEEETLMKRCNQSVYFEDLAKLVEEKKRIPPTASVPKPVRHNPITNPI